MEAKTKHTPAPWFPVQYAYKYNIQTVDCYAENDVLDLEYSPNAEANAQLISCAPEMLEVLIKLSEWQRKYPPQKVFSHGQIVKIAEELTEIVEKGDELITKATTLREV